MWELNLLVVVSERCYHPSPVWAAAARPPTLNDNFDRLNPQLSTTRSRLPAVLFCDERTSHLKIAALTLLDRLVVAVHRGGAGPITIVCRSRPPELKRTEALGIPVRLLETTPGIHEPTLMASTALLVQAADVRELLRTGGRLTTKDGTPLLIGVLNSLELPLGQALIPLRAWPTKAGAHRVTDATSARIAERALWASLSSSADGLVDKVFNRPCGRPLSKLLIHTPATPNSVSVTSILIGLVAAWFFAKGDQPSTILAALLFQLSAIVDCVDGELARIVFKESSLGKWLDLVGDQIVHVSIFAAIAIGLIRTGQTTVGHWLGLSAVFGAIASFAVVVRGMRNPSGNRGRLLQKLIDSATNRDFSVLVLILACFHSLDWFLWFSAIGSHVFWIMALSLQLAPSPEELEA